MQTETLEQDINNGFKTLANNYSLMIKNCEYHYEQTFDFFWLKMIDTLKEKRELALSQIKS